MLRKLRLRQKNGFLLKKKRVVFSHFDRSLSENINYRLCYTSYILLASYSLKYKKLKFLANSWTYGKQQVIKVIKKAVINTKITQGDK